MVPETRIFRARLEFPGLVPSLSCEWCYLALWYSHWCFDSAWWGFAQCGTHPYAHDLTPLLGFLFVLRGMEKNNKTCCYFDLLYSKIWNFNRVCVLIFCSLSRNLVLWYELNKSNETFCCILLYPAVQKETNMAVVSRMTCKIGLIWRHMKTLYCWQPVCKRHILNMWHSQLKSEFKVIGTKRKCKIRL